MRKNRILLVLIIGISVFAVFAITVITLFNSVSKNPIDLLSKELIYNNADFENEYGDIVSIGRYYLYETQKSESIMKIPYAVETTTNRVIAYVTLTKREGEWMANSFEVVEVLPNER